MFAGNEQHSTELFRPEPRSAWHPNLAFLWLFVLQIIAARQFGGLPALVAIVAYAKFAWDDFHTAIWVRRRDPVRGRGQACFWFSLSRATLNAVVAATSLAIVIDDPTGWGWHTPFDWKVPTALLAGLVVHVAFAVVGWRSASQKKVRVWLDSGLNRARRQHTWPPRCRDASNDAKNLVLVGTVLFVVIVHLGLDALAFAFTGREFPAAAILVAIVVGPLLLTRKALATTPEDCWSLDKTGAEATAASPPG